MIMMKKTLTILLLGSFVMLNSCGSEEQTGSAYDYDRSDSLSTDYTREVTTIRGNIKETSGFYFTLKNLGAAYDGSLPNNTSKASSYTTAARKCVGMGIYGADLNFLTVYEQNEKAQAYVDDISTLANDLGIESAFDQELFEQIVNTEDSLDLREKSNLVSKAFRKAEDKMYNEERALYATLMVAGGWTESVYLTSSLILDNDISEKSISDFWMLANNYYSIIKMLGVFQDDADAQEMLKKLGVMENSIKLITDKPRIKKEGVEAVRADITKLRKELI
ncbi:MAG: hypothetical protein DRI54_08255 [Bacteroidetes bacterium]|nr:MAG: hypothetical protein DRI54_08255 [Bacteroidota bacterium]